MTLAPLVNIQKTSRRQNAQGYGASSRMDHLVKGSESRSSQVREHPISHMGNATWMVRARP